MRNSYIVIMIVVAFIFGSIFGFYAGILNLSTSGNGPMPEKGQKNTFASGWMAARQELLESPEYSAQVNSLRGVVKEARNGKIAFEAFPITPLDSKEMQNRVAVITEDTEVVLRKIKTKEEYKKDREEAQTQMSGLEDRLNRIANDVEACEEEMMEDGGESAACQSIREEYQSLQREADDLYEKMEQYKKIENPDLSEIKPGYEITVMSKVIAQDGDDDPVMETEGMENIANKKTFEASSIQVSETGTGEMLP